MGKGLDIESELELGMGVVGGGVVTEYRMGVGLGMGWSYNEHGSEFRCGGGVGMGLGME